MEYDNSLDKNGNSIKINLSSRTADVFHQSCGQVYEACTRITGDTENIFKKIEHIKVEYATKDIFTDEELTLIKENANSFNYVFYVIGISIGLRCGDICTLKWVECDLGKRII